MNTKIRYREDKMPLVKNEKNIPKVPPLQDETLKLFLSYCDRRKFPKKGIIFREGDPADK